MLLLYHKISKKSMTMNQNDKYSWQMVAILLPIILAIMALIVWGLLWTLDQIPTWIEDVQEVDNRLLEEY